MKSIIISSLVFCMIIGCGKSSSLYGKLGTSDSIEESKKRQVFIHEYNLSPSKLYINDTLEIQFEKIWLENIWRFDYPFDKTLIGEGYQIIITLRESNWKQNYRKDWYLGTDYSFNFTPQGKTKLKSNIFKSNPLDYLKIEIQKENKLSNKQSKEILGKLVFIKK